MNTVSIEVYISTERKITNFETDLMWVIKLLINII